jgi:ribosome-associated translation inhibitor RaiA
MDKPVQITFHNIDDTTGLEEAVRARVNALEAYHPHIVGCRLLVDVPHRHREHGQQVQVRVTVSLPGEDVVVTHEPTRHGATAASEPAAAPGKVAEADGVRADALVAIREAFDLARRCLQDLARKSRGDVKRHEAPGLP